MPDSKIGMGRQGRSERERFENEVKRIIEAGGAAGVTLRLVGALAFFNRCPQYGHLQERMGRAYTDIDLAGYGREAAGVRALMAGLGYLEEREVFVVTEGGRAIFHNTTLQIHVDVFYEKLDFCHVIPWNGRLEIHPLTIPLAELLLEKMQIVQINEKDIIDTIMLLLEHPLVEDDQAGINMARVAKLCGDDWGLWRTVTMNLDKVRQLAVGYSQLSNAEKAHLQDQVGAALARMEAEPKSMGWRLRARVGDRVKWYKDVEEVH